MAHSVLVVPVAEMEPFVRGRHEHYDRAYVSSDPTFAHAHVTALGPFVPVQRITDSVLERVGEVVESASSFSFRLERVATFPGGIVHLVPEPAGPFRSLGAALGRAFPAYPSYAGEFANVAPHLTLDALGAGVDEAVGALGRFGPGAGEVRGEGGSAVVVRALGLPDTGDLGLGCQSRAASRAGFGRCAHP